MPPQKKLTKQERNLIRRYLVWCYKTTKEDLDKVDRYFTQQRVDEMVLADLRRTEKKHGPEYRTQVADFEAYIQKKQQRVVLQKFVDARQKSLRPEYSYLRDRLSALRKAIRTFCGEKGLREIEFLYEEEMTRRILAARDH